MIPLHDANPTRNIPIVTRLLLFTNIAIWVYIVYLSRTAGAVEAFYDRWAFDWSAFIGALSRPWNVDTLQAFIPLFTHQFLHGGWLHVLGNMLYLWIFGDNVEDNMGSLPFLGFYLLCGAIAAIGQGLVAPSPMVGASGAIAGVLGAYLVLYPSARVGTVIPPFFWAIPVPAFVLIGLWFVMNVFSGVATLGNDTLAQQQGVAFFAHIGGFATGLA